METKVMIAEDNKNLIGYYECIFSRDTNVKIMGYATDGESALKMYNRIKPDILFLDLNLPKKNGLELINDLSNYEKENRKCNIVVITGDDSLRNELFNTRKVYRIIPKPADIEILYNTVTEMETELLMENFPEKKLIEILNSLKLNPYSKSSQLLIDIVKMCYLDPDLLDNMKKIYYIIAKQNSCLPQKIQARLRSCVDTANRLSNNKMFNSLFLLNNNNELVSPKQFVIRIVNYLKKE